MNLIHRRVCRNDIESVPSFRCLLSRLCIHCYVAPMRLKCTRIFESLLRKLGHSIIVFRHALLLFRMFRDSSMFLLHNSKTFTNFELFSIFSQTFLELIFATNKIKAMLLKQSAVLFPRCPKNVAYIRCLNT